MQDDAIKETDLERAEFEAVVAAFSSTPRSLRLLRYIGDNYFAGTLTELCEFSIATEVFGRPQSQFNPAEGCHCARRNPPASEEIERLLQGRG
jgi:hypothetical protein